MPYNHRFLLRLKTESQILIPFSEHDFVRQKLIRILRIASNWSASGKMPRKVCQNSNVLPHSCSRRLSYQLTTRVVGSDSNSKVSVGRHTVVGQPL